MALGLARIARRQKVLKEQLALQEDNAARILVGANPVQRDLILDDSYYIGAVCPRRSGKTFAVTSKVLYFGEKYPGSRILVISLTLKSTVENYWSGSPGGLFAQNALYGLNLKFNTTQHTWVHPNGSRGLLAGAETKADIERLRGAAAEADIVIIDECKSFAPDHLNDLIENVVEPGLMTRDGQLVMIGTPGSIPLGPFYQATSLLSVTDGDNPTPTCIMWNDKENPGPSYSKLSKEDISELYSLHHWTIADNLAAPHQWKRALTIKRKRGWGDDHPVWRREYLGEWVGNDSDLVYAYASNRAADPAKVTWRPSPHSPTGLPDGLGPWHLVLGLDLGYVDDSAMVLVAYSETLRELRHVYDYKAPGLDAEAFASQVLGICQGFGQIEMVVADTAGGGSKMIIEMLNQRLGLAIQPAKKSEKTDHIELLNGDFNSGRVKLIPGSDLEREICGLQWDLSQNSKVILARTGRLREDPKCPNHLCDALLYAWRFSYHYYAQPDVVETPSTGSIEWVKKWEEEQLQKALSRRRGISDPMGLASIRKREAPMTRENLLPELRAFKN
jgi:hypothetical protein